MKNQNLGLVLSDVLGWMGGGRMCIRSCLDLVFSFDF